MQRDEVVRLRLTQEQKNQIRDVAKIAGLSMSDYIRECVFGAPSSLGASDTSDVRVRKRKGSRSFGLKIAKETIEPTSST